MDSPQSFSNCGVVKKLLNIFTIVFQCFRIALTAFFTIIRWRSTNLKASKKASQNEPVFAEK